KVLIALLFITGSYVYSARAYSADIEVVVEADVGLNQQQLVDSSRERLIPINITKPLHNSQQSASQCSALKPCPVVFISAGYGVSHLKYTFIRQLFNQQGYLVVEIAHELASDPMLATQGNFFVTRQENWQRGAQTLTFVRDTLKKRLPEFDFDHLTLVGHSNGGDISAWLANQPNDYISRLITLDHRRMPLPTTTAINILSIRASDFAADEGVLPTKTNSQSQAICVVTLIDAKHNDMTDDGPLWLTHKIHELIEQFIGAQAVTQQELQTCRHN
ncbi:MAG: hypothetical protein ACRCT7_05615, partial [Shewanella sp.]